MEKTHFTPFKTPPIQICLRPYVQVDMILKFKGVIFLFLKMFPKIQFEVDLDVRSVLIGILFLSLAKRS